MPLVDGLRFDFAAGWSVCKWDDTAFHRRFQTAGEGSKACDLVAVPPDGDEVWLIEVKDYRHYRREKGQELIAEVGCKVRDTLAALWSAQRNANVDEERTIAHVARRRRTVRVVLHLEEPRVDSRLVYPRKRMSDLSAKLKMNVGAIDPHPIATCMASANDVPWSVR